MISTIKFSEFLNAGDLDNSDTTVGISASTNAKFNNPWVFLPPGTTATRPVSPIVGQLRFNTDLVEYEYWDDVQWIQLAENANNSDEWQNITASTFPLVEGHAYLANNAAGVTFTLPLVASIGKQIKIAGVVSQGGWTIAQNAGQYIYIDNTSTTVGVGGLLQSAHPTQSISLVCMVPNMAWLAFAIVGNVNII